MSILVTVGSTLFPLLTDKILSSEMLSILSSHGIKQLVVQYGRAEIPTSLGVELDENGEGSKMVDGLGLEVELIKFTDDFEGLVGKSDFVVSHAGSGSILTALRRTPPKPLLVIPNESLMDNHQSELADELSEKGYLMVSKVNDLERILPQFLSSKSDIKIKPFPQMDRNKFPAILDEMMGF